MRTLHLFLFILLNVVHTYSMDPTSLYELRRTGKEIPSQKYSPRSEKAPQKKHSIISNKRNQDTNLFLKLPNDILKNILHHASGDSIFNAVTLLIQLSRACKTLRSLHEPNKMKIILGFNQRILDDNLIIYASLHLTPEQDFTPFLKILVAMDAKIKRFENLFACVGHATNAYFVEQYIIQYKPDINIQDDLGNTPLRWTVDLNKPNIAKVLLENGANMNLVNNCGETPTRMALLYGHAECIKLFIQHGVDTSIEYDYGHDYKITIAKWAANAKNEEIYKLVTKEEMPKKWYEDLISYIPFREKK
jgi:ankyrin repeat protein